MVYLTQMLLGPTHSMVDHWDRGGLVIGQFRRAHEGRLGAVLVGDVADLFVICANDDVVEQVAVLRRQDGIGDKGQTTEFAHVLAWDAFAAAASRNNCNLHDESLICRAKFLTSNSSLISVQFSRGCFLSKHAMHQHSSTPGYCQSSR